MTVDEVKDDLEYLEDHGDDVCFSFKTFLQPGKRDKDSEYLTRFVREIDMELKVPSRETGFSRSIAKAHLCWVQAGAMLNEDKHVDLWEVGDEHSGDVFDLVTEIWDRDTFDYSAAVTERYGAILNHSFLTVEKLKVEPEYRNRGLGVRLLNTIIDTFGDAVGIVALKPFPLEWSGWESDPERRTKRKEFERALERLTRYYERYGFRRITPTAMTFCTELKRQPAIKRTHVRNSAVVATKGREKDGPMAIEQLNPLRLVTG